MLNVHIYSSSAGHPVIVAWKLSSILKLENKNENIYKMSTIEDGARPLTNFDIDSLVKYLDIPNYKGTFMKDQLIGKPKETECAVINLQNSN